MFINKEMFTKLMHAALKKRKVLKPDRDAIINRYWFLVCISSADADVLIESEEQLTRAYLAKQKANKAILSEHAEQVLFCQWFKMQYHNILCYATPNGGHRDMRTAVSLKAEGVIAGVADLTILCRDGRVLFLEFKRVKGGVQSESQRDFERYVLECGHSYIIGYGFDDAKKQVLEFFKMKMTRSIETLHHFKCHHCHGWWTIGDWTPKKYMWCPHCGKRSEIEQGENKI